MAYFQKYYDFEIFLFLPNGNQNEQKVTLKGAKDYTLNKKV